MRKVQLVTGRKKHTNPVSDKILIICEVLDISPYELLSGAEHIGTRSRDSQTYVFAKDTELGMVVETYQQLDYEQQKETFGLYGCFEDEQLEKL